MTALLSGLSFTTPWLLSALLVLPAIWWFLRLTPPAPRTIQFPAIRFLLEIDRKEESAASVPWWLLFLRLVIAALVILALAGPTLNRPQISKGDRPIVIFVDNGWISASKWDVRSKTFDRLTRALKTGERLVYPITTTQNPNNTDFSLSSVKPESLSALSKMLQPTSQGTDYSVFEQYFPGIQKLSSPDIYWFSNGMNASDQEHLLKPALDKLTNLGTLTIFTDDVPAAPLVIHSVKNTTSGLEAILLRADQIKVPSGVVFAKAKNGKILGRASFEFEEVDKNTASVFFDLPAEIRNNISRLEIQGEESASAVYLLDSRWTRKSVGLVTHGKKTETPSLLEETHYLEKALLPFYDVQKDTLSALIGNNPSFIALGDTAVLSAQQSLELETWIKDGGILIRFAGPKLANAKSGLLPVLLRSGNRNLDGAMSWSKPAKLGKMPEHSPFADLPVDRNVTVSKQILANPSPELSLKTWARLEDGTPLVTADKRGRGRIILFHTTATPAWSDLVLSGLFVEMLREISYLGSSSNPKQVGENNLPPVSLLDGFGRPTDLVDLQGSKTISLSSRNNNQRLIPAGYYGTRTNYIAKNVGPYIKEYHPLNLTDITASKQFYKAGDTFSFLPVFLITAFFLTLLDGLITLILQGRFRFKGAMTGAKASLFLIILVSAQTSDSQAEESLERLLDATLETRLAYILTGNDELDQMSKAGLTGLSRQLRRRTAIEAASPLPVDLERNELLFFQ